MLDQHVGLFLIGLSYCYTILSRYKQLLQSFRNHLSNQQATAGRCLDATVKFLETTSTLVKNFTSGQPYNNISDPRFE